MDNILLFTLSKEWISFLTKGAISSMILGKEKLESVMMMAKSKARK
jgi:hypothetical protein